MESCDFDEYDLADPFMWVLVIFSWAYDLFLYSDDATV